MEDSIELKGKRCPKGYIINKKTGRCNKTKKLDVLENKIALSPESIELIGKRCPKGYTKNKTGRCKKNIVTLLENNLISLNVDEVIERKEENEIVKSVEKEEEKQVIKSIEKEVDKNVEIFEWDINDKYIFGYNVVLPKKYNKVYIFDLDYTLIKTKSGKKFPINNDDWMLLYEDIPEKIDVLVNSLIGIVSNQKGLKTHEERVKFSEKIENIRKLIKIDFVFASIEDNRYRKPMCGSFEVIKNHYKLNENNKISYIGDAAGRKNDYSDTDYKYALNCNMEFLTPELFFDKSDKEKPKITYPNIEYMTKNKESEILKGIDDIIKVHNKVLILCIGFPASGKSYIRRKILDKYPNFVYTNNDDIKDKIVNNRLVKKLGTEHNYIIDDNTNMKSVDRVSKMKMFNSYYKVGIVFDYDMEVCFHLNYMRMYMYDGKLIPKVVYYTLNKKYDREIENDGFDKVIKIDKLFNEMNHDDEIRYYF